MFDNPILHPRVYIYTYIGDLTKENVDRQKNDSWELVGQWDFHGTVMVINGTLMAI